MLIYVHSCLILLCSYYDKQLVVTHVQSVAIKSLQRKVVKKAKKQNHNLNTCVQLLYLTTHTCDPSLSYLVISSSHLLSSKSDL